MSLVLLCEVLTPYSPTTAVTMKQTTRMTTGTPDVQQEEPPAALATISSPRRLLWSFPPPAFHLLHTALADHLGNIQARIIPSSSDSILDNFTSQGVFCLFPFVVFLFVLFVPSRSPVEDVHVSLHLAVPEAGRQSGCWRKSKHVPEGVSWARFHTLRLHVLVSCTKRWHITIKRKTIFWSMIETPFFGTML